MKFFHLTLFCVLLTTAFSIPVSAKDPKGAVESSRVTVPDNKIIPGERIGAIRLGMGMDEVQTLLGKPTYWQDNLGFKDMANAMNWTYVDLNLQIWFTNSSTPHVAAIRCIAIARGRKSIPWNKVYWKDLRPVKVVFQTAEGIKIGSSTFDVIRAYGNPQLGDSSGVSWNYDSLGMRINITMDNVVNMIWVQPSK